MTTVVLVDDHPLVRQGMRAVIDTQPDITVVGEAADGADAVRVCVETSPDVVLMDLQMPQLNGLDATRQLRSRSPATAVLVLTMYDDDAMVFEAVAAGARGYLLKGSDGGDVIAAIRGAAQGQVIFGAALATRVQSWFEGPHQQPDPFPQLTERERVILDALASGRTNAEIGAQLFLSPKTIANNVSLIIDKLHFAHRTEAIIKARQAGLGGNPAPESGGMPDRTPN
jgi:DNA-binding NarL/FixJ family response regulator